MSNQKVGRPVFRVGSFGRNQFGNDLIPRAICGETDSQEFLKRVAVDQGIRRSPDQQIRPLGGKVADIGRIVEQLFDKILPF